jgi:hypothetical protein
MRYASLLVMLMLALAGIAGCSKPAVKEDTIVEILQVSDDCADDALDGCCQSTCTTFCTDKARAYTKSVVNGRHCGCWCD